MKTHNSSVARPLLMNSMQRLLIADDENTICFALEDYFTLRGFRVDCVQLIEEAFELLDTRNYAAAIVDLRLAGTDNLDGLKLVIRIREISPSTRCVILTACESVEIEADALKAGADVFLRKPKPLAELAEVIFDLLEREK